MLTYKQYDSREDIKFAAKIALNYSLYMPNRLLRFHYKNYSVISRIVIAFNENQPVAACILYTKNFSKLLGLDVSTFVKKEYRRLGIGTELLKRTVTDCGRSISTYNGDIRATLFYKSFFS